MKSEKFTTELDLVQRNARQRTAYARQEICKLPYDTRKEMRKVYVKDMDVMEFDFDIDSCRLNSVITKNKLRLWFQKAINKELSFNKYFIDPES